MRVDFYHLTATPLERALPGIAEKVVTGGHRLLIVADATRLADVDTLLWTYAPESFLPHSMAGGADGTQPVLLSERVEPANGADHLALVDGVWREAPGFARVFYFFDSGQLDAARIAWREMKERAERHYWKQDDGGRWFEGP